MNEDFFYSDKQVFPPTSKLDPSIYGPQESALKEEHIIGHLNGLSIQQVWHGNHLSIFLDTTRSCFLACF